MTDQTLKDIDRAFKALEERDELLDKIRAKIEQKIIKKPRLDFKIWERERNETLLEVLDIIDKYKTESEE